jgi:Family of unknown function (DUF6205)
MGYTTHVSGEFAITPPLTWTEFKDSPFAPHNIRSHCDPSLVLRVDEKTIDTSDGPLLRRTASALVMREIDDYRARNLVEEVQQAVDAFPGHTFTGRLDCNGEDNPDMWRVVIRAGRALRVDPRIIWPDMGA